MCTRNSRARLDSLIRRYENAIFHSEDADLIEHLCNEVEHEAMRVEGDTFDARLSHRLMALHTAAEQACERLEVQS